MKVLVNFDFDGTGRISNLLDPVSAQDAATKNYVITQLASYVLTSAFTFTNLGSKPTTLSGFGITDAVLTTNFTFANLGSKPTTLAGYGITDAQATTAGLTAFLALGTTGFVKKTAANAYSLDTSTYLTANQTVTLSGDATGSGATAITITLAASGVTAGTYKSVTVDAKGRVTGGTNPTTLSGYGITDAVLTTNFTFANLGTKPTTLSGYGITDAQPLHTGLTNIATASANASVGFFKKTAANTWSFDTSTYLTANQSITLSGDATGSGTTAITVTLSASGVTAGTYKSVTVDAKGRVTEGTNPTTLSGYGITDAQATTAGLTAFLALGASGFVKKTSANAYSLDTSTYLTANQTVTISGDASGSGATAITLTLASSGVTAGTYKSVTVDAKGRVTGGTNPTTLSGYGITDSVVKKSSSTIGNGSSTSIAVTHNLGTQDVEVVVRKVADNAMIIVDWVATDNNTVTLTYASDKLPASNAHRVTVFG